MRTKGSCRFEPYYKVQVWDARKVAWMDIQKAHPTPEEARGAAKPGQRARIMTVTERGRAPGEPFDA